MLPNKGSLFPQVSPILAGCWLQMPRKELSGDTMEQHRQIPCRQGKLGARDQNQFMWTVSIMTSQYPLHPLSVFPYPGSPQRMFFFLQSTLPKQSSSLRLGSLKFPFIESIHLLFGLPYLLESLVSSTCGPYGSNLSSRWLLLSARWQDGFFSYLRWRSNISP